MEESSDLEKQPDLLHLFKKDMVPGDEMVKQEREQKTEKWKKRNGRREQEVKH